MRCTIDNLNLADNENDDIARHIVGTKIEDLSQIYTGKVIIRGSLTVSNIILDRPKKTFIYVGKQPFYLNVFDYYWMKSIDQVSYYCKITST